MTLNLCPYTILLILSYNLLPTHRQLQRHRLTPQPQRHKARPPSNRNRNASNPRPGTSDDPTPRPLVVREVADGDGGFFFEVGEKGPLVVDFEVENSVLVGDFEAGGPDG
jgi:hypothetical protein